MKVYVGLSGGVDSSVTAAVLKELGHDVTGVYMKNWSQDISGFECPWKQDYQDAKRIAVQLGIPFKLYDFEKQYRQLVVNYMLDGYRQGVTPNPDVLCNQEIKFKLFLQAALADGADSIATGHYARVRNGELHEAANVEKDQTYFLYRVNEEALKRTLMPIGEYVTKDEVRAKAADLGLATAQKKDSQGICFVGKVGIKEFLLHELGEQLHGLVVDQNGIVIGEHDGALYYTIGQRQGLGIGGGLPYYVTGKDMAKNEVYVTTDINDKKLWTQTFTISKAHWINNLPEPNKTYQIRTRYRAEKIPATLLAQDVSQDIYSVMLESDVRALTPGQSAVVYDADRVLGGGIVV